MYSICRRYDEMAEKVSDVPDTTEEIVGLQEYLKTVSSMKENISNCITTVGSTSTDSQFVREKLSD